ncbi:sulfatase-like hydrolase/transferase [Jiella sonneratiae]|uniref:Sulfatase-like hydrolase/transferase n=1 Tax=Jiella sonneratiae TaxID=2816856 RepID=A0ABS3J726_9HYPH|nr:sulfatase-like hydrolase/transferase [Jiella sonneratiae]MBO0904778.1 sulfatase-like hydrolase/transferase [Jiella sonneratiae]
MSKVRTMAASALAPRPNILLLMTDQQRFDALGCAGNPDILTPNLDRLAAAGAMFETCYVQNPICSPSRASFATGLYPHNHGLWANGVALPEALPLISKVLADGGYDCGMAGKQHLAPCANGDEPRLDDGYRVYRWSHDPIHRSPQNSYHLWLKANHPEIYAELVTARADAPAEAGNVAKGATLADTLPVEAHYSHWIAEEAIAFIGEARDRPFYFMANFFDPHHPFGAPEPFRALYDAAALPLPVGSAGELAAKPAVQREYHAKSYGGHAPGFAEYSEAELREARAGYYAMVSMIDAEVGRILDVLQATGQLDNTLVVFTSDHGEMLGDHAIMLKGPMLYEPVVRVPLILHWPPAIGAGQRIGRIVQNIDLTATLLDVSGMRDALSVQGESLMPLVAEPAAGAAAGHRDWALCEYRDSGHGATPAVHTTMLRHGSMKLVIWHGSPATDRTRDGELYDLAADPDETVNLFHDPARRDDRERMKDLLIDVLEATEWPRPIRTAEW